MAELIGRRYALALFEVGLDLEKVKEFHKELEFVESVFEGEKKLIQILGHPKIKKDEKKALIDKLFKERLSGEIVNFLYILIDKRREAYILDIVNQYKGLFNEHENIVKVVAISAIPMEERSKAKLVTVLGNKLGKNIQLTNQVDSSIIGGIMLKTENEIMDGTLKGQLKSLGRIISGATN